MIKNPREVVRGAKRFKQVADWIREEIPYFIQRVEDMYLVSSEDAFKLFVSDIDNQVSWKLSYYVLELSYANYGRLEFLRKLFYYMFGHIVMRRTRDKFSDIDKNFKQRKLAEVEKYKKVIDNKEIVFIHYKHGYELRGRDIKTGQYIKREEWERK